MKKTVLAYMTAADRREAARIGRALVKERLAACVNILGRIESFYWWEGKVCDGKEVAFIAKTRADLAPALIKRVRALHSYSVPCVVTLPILGGNAAFMKWIETETEPSPRPSPKGRGRRLV